MSDRYQMGATVHDGGVSFRVWAPFAQQVAVVGDFNDWDASAHPLQRTRNGRWSGEVPGAGVGQEYRFHLVASDGSELSRIDPYARQVTNSVGNGVIYDHGDFDWQGDDYGCPPRDDLVIYELHIGSFYAEDPSRPGTFEMAYSRLDHLVALGINAIEIMPVMEFAGDRSWGYNPAHPFAVESVYGGPDALKTLVREAHRRGLAVIVDVVYNHFGPSDLDLWQFDGWSENGKGGIYFYNDDRSQTPWGDTRPDYGRPEVRQYIYDNAVSWLRDFHADGLRWDMTPYVRSVDGGGQNLPDGWSLMQEVNEHLSADWPDVVLLAEDMQGKPEITSVAKFHAQWDGAFVHPVRAAMIAMDDGSRSMPALAQAVATRYNDDAFQRVVYTESHDEVANGRARLPEEIDGENPRAWHARKRSMLGAAITLTSPGIPMLFQGQEFLEDEWFRDDVPLEWHLSEEFHGVVRAYADLIQLRRNVSGGIPGLRGQHVGVTHVDDQAKVLAYVRSSAPSAAPGDALVVVNASHQEYRDYYLGTSVPGRWELVFNGDARAYSDDFGDVSSGDLYAGPDARGAITIAPYTAQVFRLA
ncbi:alpha-amylase family glycosyl hydrolase [Demetria terragena]|uniref:alpha-amylase family glycosyl hydrolase n=1 Tax=Demetria terragena TaxID=63959 RepID=UPI000476D00E|nr:alpha-amylase family glycosyl hydrolase [Demetria terragena]